MNNVIRTIQFASGQRLELVHGDLTLETVDAIVNAANSRLAHGGGVAGAIVRRGGASIQRESDAWVAAHGQVTHASPAFTGAGRLSCRTIIHAVGPVWGSGDEEAKLAAAVHGSLALAEQLGLASLAMPPISTGIFGFPRRRAAQIFLEVIRGYFDLNPGSGLRLARVTILDEETLTVFEDEWPEQ